MSIFRRVFSGEYFQESIFRRVFSGEYFQESIFRKIVRMVD
jgi:hypothetical protein